MPIGIAIAVVIIVVIYSYRQTMLAYAQGASDYIVAKDNLGTLAGLTAGGALLIDYTHRGAHLRCSSPDRGRSRSRHRGKRDGIERSEATERAGVSPGAREFSQRA